jgi:hypothetical protein
MTDVLVYTDTGRVFLTAALAMFLMQHWNNRGNQ